MANDWVVQLVRDGLISADQLEEAKDMARSLGIKLEEALIRLDYVTMDDIGRAQAAQFGYEFVNLDGMDISPAAIELVPESVARENIVIPIALENDALKVAIHDPMLYEVLDKLRFILNRDITVVLAPKEAIQAAINRNYGASETESVDSMLAEFTETAIDFTEIESGTSGSSAPIDDENAPIIKLVNLIITEAVNLRARGMHV